ncbi:SMP-30/gluconolactonase/LRE family protein [bacterium]|nr:SMP-30/gluconolactonase/LRE family protein [bacterium]
MKKWLVLLCIGIFTLSFSGCSKISPTSPSSGSSQGMRSLSVGESYEFVTKWCSHACRGVAVDNAGYVYVTDADNHCVRKYDADGDLIEDWVCNGHFDLPAGVAVDNAGKNIYVADLRNDRIQKFDANGNFITEWGSYWSFTDVTSDEDGDGKFNQPSGVAVDNAGNVYVADLHNHRIQKFDANGNFITKWGSETGESGAADGEFNQPSGVAVDNAGNVYVADQGNDRIQKFDENGDHLATWGSEGSLDGQFKDPFGIAVDNAGNIYVADVHNYRIQKFDASGNFITKWGSVGGLDGQFSQPLGVAVDNAGNVYVADKLNDRIQKFNRTNVEIYPGTINLKSKGKYIKAYIELSEGYDVNYISSVKMEMPSGTIIPADADWTQVGDHDGDGIADLMVKFDRTLIQDGLLPGNVELTVKGCIQDINFSFSQFVNVIDAGKEHFNEEDSSSIVY